MPPDRWYSRPAGGRRRAAWLASAFLLLGAAGTGAVLVTRSGGSARPVAYCGLVACAALPSGGAGATATRPAGKVPAGRAHRSGAAAPPSAVPATPARSPSPSPPAPSQPAPAPSAVPPSPTPTPTRPPAPTSAPTRPPGPAAEAATASYSVPQRWDGGFQGELTIVNHSAAPLRGWRIALALPGDQVTSLWNAAWRMSWGGVVLVTAASYDPVIAPGAALSVDFVAQGAAAVPVSCVFNGSACHLDAAVRAARSRLWRGPHPPGRHRHWCWWRRDCG